MPVAIVVGVQWGDEGKGKVVDYLTERANLVVRFQGGDNAGHTVVVEGEKTALKLIPSGILRPDTRCLLASGVVLNPRTLFDEIGALEAAGVSVTPERLGIAGEVQLILPYHRAIDQGREERRSANKIGTTGKGIGPAYEDSVSRIGIRLIDLVDHARLKELVLRNVKVKNLYLGEVLQVEDRFDAEELYEELVRAGERLAPYIANVSQEVAESTAADKFVMFEGAQGCLLDIHHGTYPYVTSSNTVAGFACASAGFSPRKVDMILGICKAYSTRVGGGPFPTEDSGAAGDILRDVGREYGTVTGRPRRCGWFDSVAVRRAIRLNGIETLFLTKLDVLSEFDSIKLGVSYQLDGQTLTDIPPLASQTEQIKPVYVELEGWKSDITGVRTLEELPEAARQFISRIEELAGCPVGGFSVGPGREQTIVLDERVKGFAELS